MDCLIFIGFSVFFKIKLALILYLDYSLRKKTNQGRIESMKPLKEKKPFQAPHTFVILVALILLAVAATYVVPAGEYTRYTDEATNRTSWKRGASIMSNLIR